MVRMLLLLYGLSPAGRLAPGRGSDESYTVALTE